MKKVNSYFTEGQIKALKKLSVDTGLTVAELLRRAVDYYLEDKDGRTTNKREG